MKYRNTTRLRRNALRAAITGCFASCLLATAPSAFSQTVSATLRGQVTSNAAPSAGASVTATNKDTGFTRSAQASANGSYSLAGLPPGTYKIDVTANGATSTETVTLQVGETATVNLDTKPQELSAVVVSGERIVETKTSEVVTYVTPKQIEMLPQSSRNFLAFADTIPGVQFVQSSNGSTEVRSGAQSSDGVNVYIDGVSQKDYVTRGGISGQGSLSDSPLAAPGTRGNPFPQLAISEYKVITSNYKAEFDQLSSAAIVAATRSGTNEFHAEGFWDKTSDAWRAADPFEAASGSKAASKQEQYGVAVGGPIIQDRMHFFATYEKKNFESPQRVFANYGTVLPPQYAGLTGNFSEPFEESLGFAKIDWSIGDAHLLWLTAKIRDETEQAFGPNETPSFATNKKNREYRYDLRYEFTAARFLNDAHITYEDATFNPRPATSGYGVQLTNGPTQDFTVLTTGAGSSYEDRGQKGFGFQDDLTINAFDWLGSHSIKTGIKFKSIDLNTQSQTPYNPIFTYDLNGSLTIPWQVQFGEPLPVVDTLNVESKDKQYGIYLQDDWDVTHKLQLNLGLRYDYETTPSYLNYVTPADVLAAFNTQDTNPADGGHPAAPPGQTYAQTLALGGVDISNYISNGHNRKAFTGGIQPRLGFSYDLQEDQRHVIFGGLGRAYDRNVFEYLARESSKGTYPTYTRYFDSPSRPCTPGVADCLTWDPSYYDPANLAALVAANPSLGREFFMLRNDIRTPYSDQFSVGMRNRITLGQQDWITSATLSYVRGKDGIVFLLGNRWPDGTFRTPGTTWGGQPWGSGIPGYGSFFLGTNGVESKATSVLISIEKPYTKESGWGTTIAYTFTDAYENRENIGRTDETYAFDFPSISDYSWTRSTSVPKHRLVATGIYDAPWEITLSAKLTLASPTPFDAVNCLDAVDANHCYFQPGLQDLTFGFRQFDLAAQKEFKVFRQGELGIRFDLLNAFNWANVDTVDSYRGDPGVPSPTYRQPQAYLQPTRTFKLSLNFKW